MSPFSVIVCFAALAVTGTAAVKGQRCSGYFLKHMTDWDNNAVISPCEQLPCTVSPGQVVSVRFLFITDKKVDRVWRMVSVKILGYFRRLRELDGVLACDSIYTRDGTPAGCPLQANTIYSSEFNFTISKKPRHLEYYLGLWDLTKNVNDQIDGDMLLCTMVPIRVP